MSVPSPDVALPTSGKQIQAEREEFVSLGTAGRVPIHDAPNRKDYKVLKICNRIRFMNFESYSERAWFERMHYAESFKIAVMDVENDTIHVSVDLIGLGEVCETMKTDYGQE